MLLFRIQRFYLVALCVGFLVACAGTSRPINPYVAGLNKKVVAAEKAGADDILLREKSRLVVEQYEWSPFTMSLIGQADIPDGGVATDFTIATDVAYCTFLFERDASQTRSGSDYSKSAKSTAEKLRLRLDSITGNSEHSKFLVWAAEDLFYEAIDYGRNSSNPFAAMNFNFGGHKPKCLSALSESGGDQWTD